MNALAAKANNPDKPFQLVGVGNALLDIISQVPEGFVDGHNLTKGVMHLIERDRSDRLVRELGDEARQVAGGSCGNTMAVFSEFGGRGAFIGRIGLDEFGESFNRSLEQSGVRSSCAHAGDSMATGRCAVLVTPDAHRTMATFLGAAADLTEENLDLELLESTAVLYMEGYLFDKAMAKRAFRSAAQTTRRAGGLTAISMSDPFCVNRHREEFLTLLQDHIDVVFANEDETCALFETDQFDEAARQMRSLADVCVLTRSEKGAVAFYGDQDVKIDAFPPDQLQDLTGAGDAFAAGFLYGFTEGADLKKACDLGALAASEVISHYGARLESDIRAYIRERSGHELAERRVVPL